MTPGYQIPNPCFNISFTQLPRLRRPFSVLHSSGRRSFSSQLCCLFPYLTASIVSPLPSHLLFAHGTRRPFENLACLRRSNHQVKAATTTTTAVTSPDEVPAVSKNIHDQLRPCRSYEKVAQTTNVSKKDN